MRKWYHSVERAARALARRVRRDDAPSDSWRARRTRGRATATPRSTSPTTSTTRRPRSTRPRRPTRRTPTRRRQGHLAYAADLKSQEAEALAAVVVADKQRAEDEKNFQSLTVDQASAR